MSGSRTKTGCWTCRLRRKKCDEQKPACVSCTSRNLECYGYGEKPDWMLDKQNWQEVLESDEARAIRVSAEKAYLRRRQKKLPPAPWATGGLIHDIGEMAVSRQETSQGPDRTWSDATQTLRECDYTPNYEHVQTFLNVIFPLQWGFFDLQKPGRGWFFDSIIASEPLYHASRGLCASFESGLRAGSTSGRCEITPEVRQSRVLALKGLRPYITELQQEQLDGSVLPKAVNAIAIILLLSSLEIFGETEGDWEVHQQAAGSVVGLIETRIAPPCPAGNDIGAIGHLISSSAPTYEVRALEFFVTTYIWTDIFSEALHGATHRRPSEFDYLPLLRKGILDTRSIMGCDTPVMLAIKEINILAHFAAEGLKDEHIELATNLYRRIQRLRLEMDSQLTRSENSSKEDSDWVTTLHAIGALIYLGSVVPLPRLDIQEMVTACLETLEAMHPRLLIRVCWPFTIAGCMATEDQYMRFRALIQRTENAGYVLGFTWKGITVMETCWELRQSRPEIAWCWRTTMQYMRARILLI